MRKVLLILVPDNAARPGAIQYRVLILDDTAQRNKAGTLRILNLSGLELSGTINRGSVTLQDGADEFIRVGDSAVVNLQTPFHGRFYQAYAETLPIDHPGGAVLLLLPPYRRGSLEVNPAFFVRPWHRHLPGDAGPGAQTHESQYPRASRERIA